MGMELHFFRFWRSLNKLIYLVELKGRTYCFINEDVDNVEFLWRFMTLRYNLAFQLVLALTGFYYYEILWHQETLRGVSIYDVTLNNDQ